MPAFVSVKLSQVGRAQTFLLPDLTTEPAGAEAQDTAPAEAPAAAPVPIKTGETVVVETGQGSAAAVCPCELAEVVVSLDERPLNNLFGRFGIPGPLERMLIERLTVAPHEHPVRLSVS